MSHFLVIVSRWKSNGSSLPHFSLSQRARDNKSLYLLIYILVATIPLKNHGELTSRAKCLPLQYQLNATRGVKQAQNSNPKLSNQNLVIGLTHLQEKEAEKTTDLSQKKCFSPIQVSPTESGMFYELSNKRRMECERYQDCSWFHQKSMKGELSNKLSLAEAAEPIIDTNEFDLAMQFANAHTIPWGDEYLEVFDDDLLLEEKLKMGEKNQNFINQSTENFLSPNYKSGDDSVYNTYNINFSLKKVDSFDSMKVVTSTNPAEIIPISYKEKINNANYGLTSLSDVKNEVKEEIQIPSPESNTYLMDSDESDLNIGREEIVEEVNLSESLIEKTNKENININFKVESENSYNDTSHAAFIEKASNNKIISNSHTELEKKNKSLFLDVKSECFSKNNNNNKDDDDNKVPLKLDLNLDLNKVNFEQSISVSTPDLDFMDLVDYINEEMFSQHTKPTSPDCSSNKNSSLNPPSGENLKLLKNDTVFENNVPIYVKSVLCNSSFNGAGSDNVTLKEQSAEINESSTVKFDEMSDASISIAERIKTSAKRRTQRKCDVNVLEVSEEEVDCDSANDDDDYDYKEDVTKRKFVSLNKRSRSITSESSNGSSKKLKEEIESSNYRERRDKNNEASRRSRQNRKDREKRMFKTLEEEEKRNVKLKAEAEVLEKQVTSLRQLLLQVVLKKGSAT